MPGSRETTTEILNARQSVAHAQTYFSIQGTSSFHDLAIACIAEFTLQFLTCYFLTRCYFFDLASVNQCFLWDRVKK